MKPRKISQNIIPAKNAVNAYIFYRDIFDFLQQGPEEARVLIVDKKEIQFKEFDKNIELEIKVRDNLNTVTNHLINYFVDIIKQYPSPYYKNKNITEIYDLDKNLIKIESN